MLDKLIYFICEELDFDESNINGETLLGELVGDELEINELLQTVENEFDVQLGDEIDGDCSLSRLAEMIE